MLKKCWIALATCAALSPASATLTFTFTETGSDVVLTTSGTLNTAGLSLVTAADCMTGIVSAMDAALCTGSGLSALYSGVTGPVSIGSGGLFTGTSTVGPSVYLVGRNGWVAVPVGYVAGAPLSGTTTFAGATLASLGVTPGTYTWTLGSGATADTIVVAAGAVPAAASIPTLGEYALMGLAGLLMLATVPALRRRP